MRDVIREIDLCKLMTGPLMVMVTVMDTESLKTTSTEVISVLRKDANLDEENSALDKEHIDTT